MILAGLLACSAARHLPIVDWTVVCRSGSRAIARGELTATGIAPDLHRTSLLMAPRRQPKSRQIYTKFVNLHKDGSRSDGSQRLASIWLKPISHCRSIWILFNAFSKLP